MGAQVPCREFNVRVAFTHMYSRGSMNGGQSVCVACKENVDAYGCYNSKRRETKEAQGYGCDSTEN